MKWCIRLENKNGVFIAYLSHKNRMKWRLNTAKRLAVDYAKINNHLIVTLESDNVL